MSHVNASHPEINPENPPVDPLLVFCARARARVRLLLEGIISVDRVLDLAREAERRELMSEADALVILRAAYRLELRAGQWL